MIVAAIGSFLLLLVVAYLIGSPFLAPVAAGPVDEVQLDEDRARVLSLVRELDMEFATGKVSRDEYEELRAKRVAELGEIDRALEASAEARAAEIAADEAAAALAMDTDDDLEREIALRRRELEQLQCSSCGTPANAEDHFCRTCGADITTTGTRGTR